MRKLTVEELENIQNANNITGAIKNVVDILLLSMNDWPFPVDTVDDFENQIHDFIKGETTKEKINAILTHINYNTQAWQAESLSQLIDVFDYYKQDTTLKEIILDVKIKLE